MRRLKEAIDGTGYAVKRVMPYSLEHEPRVCEFFAIYESLSSFLEDEIAIAIAWAIARYNLSESLGHPALLRHVAAGEKRWREFWRERYGNGQSHPVAAKYFKAGEP